MTLELFVATIFITALIALYLAIMILRFTLDRRVRKALPKDKVYDSFPDWYFGIGRAISFGSAALFERVKRSDYMKKYYNGFDVKTFANTFEKVVAWVMLLSVITMFSIIIASYILEWFGIFSWNN